MSESVVLLPEPPARTPLTLEHVAAQVAQNIAGGLGLGAALTAALWALGLPAAGAWPYALALAVAGAGLATAARAWADEWRDASARAQWEAALTDYESELEQQDGTIATLNATNADLRAEVARLRWIVQQRETPAYVAPRPAGDPAHADARTLLEYRYATGRHPALRLLRERGWTDARYSEATSVLQACGALDLSAPTHPRWPLDAQAAAAALAGAGAAYDTTPHEYDTTHDTGRAGE